MGSLCLKNRASQENLKSRQISLNEIANSIPNNESQLDQEDQSDKIENGNQDQDDNYIKLQSNQQDLEISSQDQVSQHSVRSKQVNFLNLLNPTQKQKDFLSLCQYEGMNKLKSLE